jgi:hypothetical protein
LTWQEQLPVWGALHAVGSTADVHCHLAKSRELQLLPSLLLATVAPAPQLFSCTAGLVLFWCSNASWEGALRNV